MSRRRSHTAQKLRDSSNSQIELLTLRRHRTKYALEGYKVFFSTKLARQYEPIIYSGKGMSGDPEAVYYRILQSNDDHRKNELLLLCIQYFYYWKYQNCMMASHGHDYEPIFIYLKYDDSNPYLIVNGGLGKPNCRFHKNEVRPRNGKRDSKSQHITANLSRYPFYPFGKDGNVKYHACVSTYPLDTGKDLQFEESYRPLFGILACSNVFSGARHDLHGRRFKPPLKRMTDRVLNRWYFHHYKNANDMPFGHDIADSFTSPYIKFHKPSREEVERLRKQRR